MPVSMYSVSIPVFMQHLNGLSGVLDKAATWAAARKVNEADLLNMRLSPDMFNLARQIRAATDHAVNCAGMLSGKEAPKLGTEETTLAQFKERIAKAIAFLKTVQQSEVDGTDGKEIKFTAPNGNVMNFTVRCGQGSACEIETDCASAAASRTAALRTRTTMRPGIENNAYAGGVPMKSRLPTSTPHPRMMS